MAINRPTQEQLADIVDRLGMSMSADEVGFYRESLQGVLDRHRLPA